MSIERKYKKRLNRNGWMAKLQRFTWGGKTPDFAGYCPFFWFTWLSLPMALIKAVLLALAIMVIGPFLGLRELWERLPHRPKRPTEERLLEVYELVQTNGISWVTDTYIGTVSDWIMATPDWWNCVLEAVARRDRKEAKQQAKDNRDKRRLQWLANKLHHVVKPLAYLIFVAVAIFAVTCVVKFFIWAWPFIYWPKVGEVLLIILTAIVVCCLVIAVSMGLRLLLEFYRRKCPRCPGKIGFGLKIWNVITIPFSFLGETIDVIYTRECPLIEWSEKSGPIEYND